MQSDSDRDTFTVLLASIHQWYACIFVVPPGSPLPGSAEIRSCNATTQHIQYAHQARDHQAASAFFFPLSLLSGTLMLDTNDYKRT